MLSLSMPSVNSALLTCEACTNSDVLFNLKSGGHHPVDSMISLAPTLLITLEVGIEAGFLFLIRHGGFGTGVDEFLPFQ
jgi:hypothetical protein